MWGIGRHAVKHPEQPAPVIQVDVAREARLGVRHGVVGLKIHLLVLDPLARPFYEHVDAPCTLTVYAAGCAALREHARDLCTLNSLPWSVLKPPGLPYFRQSFLDGVDAESVSC